MSHKIFERDSQHGTTMGWHGKTKVAETLEKEVVYAYDVYKDYLYRNSGNTKHGEWYTPSCSDDGLPIGNKPCLNDETYALLDPRGFWDHVNEMIEGTNHKIVSGGSVQNRSKLFISVKLNDLETVIVGDREFDIYLNFISSMDRSLPFTAINTSFCTVCYNTLVANFQAESLFKNQFRHSAKSFDENMESLKYMIDDTFGVVAEFKAAMQELDSVPCKEVQSRQILAGYFASEGAERKIADSPKMATRLGNTVDGYVELYKNGRGNNGETMLDLLSAVTEGNTRTDDTGNASKTKRLINGEYDIRPQGKQAVKANFAKAVFSSGEREKTQLRGQNILALMS